MRTLENYELVVSGEDEEKLLLTFDWGDLVHLPMSATAVTVSANPSQVLVVFEDDQRWEEVVFVNLPLSLHDMMKNFDTIYVVGLSDKVEMFSEVKLAFAEH